MEVYNKFDFQRGVILNINKPCGWTSFNVVKKVRKLTGIKKIGHAGTLDPFADGVLLVCTGKATKTINKLMELEKEYIGEIEFGVITDTLDVTGNVLEKRQVKNYSLAELKKVCQKFEGRVPQIPPMYSAIKINGVRLYKLAREGKIVPRQPRWVRIHKIKILEVNLPLIKILVNCSKGTYIRALARDIGEELSCGGYLKSLTRTRIGNYKLEDSVELNDLKNIITI